MLRKLFDFRITLPMLGAILLFVMGWVIGQERLRAGHEQLKAQVEEHVREDKKRFAEFETKENQAGKDRMLEKKLDEIIRRLDRIERLHLKQ